MAVKILMLIISLIIVRLIWAVLLPKIKQFVISLKKMKEKKKRQQKFRKKMKELEIK